MKILIVTQYYWPEQFRINDIAKGLIEKGHSVTVLTGLPNYPKGSFFKGYGLFGPYRQEVDGVKIIRVPLIPRGASKGLMLALNYLSFMMIATMLAPFVVRGAVDRIFVYQLSPVFSTLPAILLKYIKRAPVYFWVTDIWPESLSAALGIKSKLLVAPVTSFVKFVYKHSDKILVSSNGFIEHVEKQGVSSDKIKYWPQWGEKLFREKKICKKEAEGLSLPEGFRVMFAGNIGTSQSFETIVDAAEKLKEHKNIHWIILGDGLKKKWLEKEIEKRCLLEQFHLIGSHPFEKMPMYYSKADVLLFSLKKDSHFSSTLPGKVQTYLASAKAIVASIDGEGARVINEAQCGIACPASDPEALAQAVLKLSRLPCDELNAMGNRSVEYFDNNFNRDILLSKLEDLMQ